MKNSKRITRIPILLLTVFCLVLSAGCGKKTLSADNPVTLTLWHVYGNQTQSPFNDTVDAFNRTEGKEQGIVVKVVSVTTSEKIDRPLLSAAAREPGAPPMPNLFFAYPRMLDALGTKKLLPWDEVLDKATLDAYQPEFLENGKQGDHVYVLPVAKSIELFYLNRTYWDRFAAANGVDDSVLSDFEEFLALCPRYYAWSGGKNLFHVNEIYHYFTLNVASLGETLVKDGRIDCDSLAFRRVFAATARATFLGGFSIENGYATDRWYSGVVISHTGSSAGILYMREAVTNRATNVRESITVDYLPHPPFAGGKRFVLHRGAGLFAVRSEDERVNRAAAVFGKWLGAQETNLSFVKKLGYFPVNRAALQDLLKNPNQVDDPRYQKLYLAMQKEMTECAWLSLPRYRGMQRTRAAFESQVRLILARYRREYHSRVPDGSADETVLATLIEASRQELKRAVNN